MSELSDRIAGTFTDFPATHDLLTDMDRTHEKLLGLGTYTADERAGLDSYEESFEVRFVYNSNAIEGSTLTMGETALVLSGDFVPNRPGRDYFAARGCADGMAYYRRAIAAGREVDEAFICDLHERTVLDCQPATRGVYRRHPVYIRGSEMVPANWLAVPELMACLITSWTNSYAHPVLKAVAFHALFEQIHPFADGNGRTGRLVLNHMLESTGYPPIAITAERRGQYLKALESWQTKDDTDGLIMLVAEAIAYEMDARIACVLSTRLAT